MHELSPRQRVILELVTREHMTSAAPVGSRKLVEACGLDVSPATIRHEMALLERAGYLRQPYTSAGRVPTAQGYRYFVQHLMREVELLPAEQTTIRHQFHQIHQGRFEQWGRLAAAILARKCGVAALIMAPVPARSHFRRMELLPLHRSRAILVLVLEEGIVERRVLDLERPLSPHALMRTSAEFNQAFIGRTADEIRMIKSSLTGFAHRAASHVVQIMTTQDTRAEGQLFYEGLTTVLEQPEFADGRAARRLIDLLENPAWFRRMLAEVLTHSGVQVLIGGEGRWDTLREYGMVAARYGVDGYALGALGLLGPIRMPYERAVPMVRYMTELMSDLVRDTYEG